eukprot:COSAG02_NODE_389_length_23251_cov_259.067640_9_plen_326_part_00
MTRQSGSKHGNHATTGRSRTKELHRVDRRARGGWRAARTPAPRPAAGERRTPWQRSEEDHNGYLSGHLSHLIGTPRAQQLTTGSITMPGAAERSRKMLVRRRKRRISPVFSKEDVVAAAAAPAEIHVVKIDRGRMGRVTTTERFMMLGDDALSWRKRGDATASRSLPIDSITQITLGCSTTHGIAATEPWATLRLSAEIGKGRGSQLRRFYFAVTEPREARGLMMALQEKSFPGRAPVSLGQLLWQTARLRAVHRAKKASLAGIDYVRPRDIVRTLWRDALQHRRVSAASSLQSADSSAVPAVDGSRSRTFEESPLGLFFRTTTL